VDTPYVEQREGAFFVKDSRVSIDSIIHAFLSGESAESIAQAYPVLSLEQVYGTITFYLAHREELDAYLQQRIEHFEALRETARAADPMFYSKLADAKKQTPLVRG
jgi:uncharacterized protein (DUF433 family)